MAAARRLFPGAPEPFIDLSTGINPHSYPLPALPTEIFARLPDRTSIRGLSASAAQAYGAPSVDHVAAAPGTQILLPHVAALVPPGRAAILRTTYAEHARAAALAGHRAADVSDLEQLRQADLAIVVNPNNPDGRVIDKAILLSIADDLRQRGGVLIVDESFADVMPQVSLAGEVERDNIVVLRSFGKFYGLAGLRLGFALAAPHVINRIEAVLGPWAVAGPAIEIGRTALADNKWRQRTLDCLAADAKRLDGLLTAAGLAIIGGTSLYRLAQPRDTGELFNRLGRAGILVRRFAEEPNWLRFGLPGDDIAWRRLTDALARR